MGWRTGIKPAPGHFVILYTLAGGDGSAAPPLPTVGDHGLLAKPVGSKSTAHEWRGFGVYCVLRMFRWEVWL